MNTNESMETSARSRRRFLLGAGAAAAGLSILSPRPAYGQDPLPPVGTWPWPADGLDPVLTARGATTGLSGCANVSFGLIVNQLKEKLPGSVWSVIPPTLASAFNGGGPYGSDCGALQGPLFVMTLVGAPPTLKQELYKWYCDFAFPSTEWDDLYPIRNTVQTIAHSPLCHESRAIWEGVFTRQVFPVTGVYDNTRCSKLPRDCTKKAVELINAFKLHGYQGTWLPDPSYTSCYDCHTDLYTKKLPGGIHSGKEDCTHCHTVAGGHPKPRRGRR